MQTRDAAVEAHGDACGQARRRFSRRIALARGLLASRAAPALVIGFAVMLSMSTLALGFSVDEYYQRVALSEHSELAGMKRAPWDLYTFAAPRVNAQLMEEGILPWWTDPELTISFFRPLSALTLFADHVLWRDHGVLFHVENVLWYAALLATVCWVYREFRATPALPALPLLLYAIDDARAQVVGWVSLRNAPIALIPAFAALIFHRRYRRGLGAHYGWLAPAALSLGLLGGEVSVAVLGYLVAYAVFMERGSPLKRALSLLPYVAVLVPYRIVYNAFGFGALYSGLYVDPAREPLAFLFALVSHLPVLLLSQFVLFPAEIWESSTLIAPWLQPALYVAILLALGLLVKLLWPLLRGSDDARFWALGSVLSLIPTCGTFPADRLLVAASLGASVLIADLLRVLFDSTRVSRTRRGLGYSLLFVHCLFAPLFFTVRARDITLTERALGHADRSISRAPEIAQKTVIIINPVISAFGTYFPIYREAKGIQRPLSFRHLASAESTLTISRLDAHTLRVRADDGFLFSVSQRTFRAQSRRFEQGDTVRLSDMTVVVDELMPDGTPAVVRVRLDKMLDDPSVQWLRWQEHDYVPLTLPALGQQVVLAKLDVLPILLSTPDAQ